MATLNLQRFTSVGTLRAIHPELMTQLLAPYHDFLAGRGVFFSPMESREIDYEGLASVFMHPDEDTPHDLAEALYFINEMSTPEGMEQLLDEAAKCKVALDYHPDSTPEDVAIQVWLADREIIERKHAEQFLTRPKSFEYFQSQAATRPIGASTKRILQGLEENLDDWFVEKGRGRTSKVFVYPKGDETWFLVRHGNPYKREGSIKDGESTSVFYRPEAFDVVIYNCVIGEIRIHADTMGIKNLYRRQFGIHFFGSEDFFPVNGKAKYTLEPLRRDGPSSLVCSDVEGLEWVRLRELHFYWGGQYSEVEIRRASDLLAAFAWRNRPIKESARMVQAKFQIKFANAKNPRTLTIRPSNIASFNRDGDSVLCETWLARRGFVLNQPPVESEAYPSAPDETRHAAQVAALA